jgi:hypothetical protein
MQIPEVNPEHDEAVILIPFVPARYIGRRPQQLMQE